jgi:hypothetical protein
MPTFLIERVIPPAFNVTDPDQVALHARWALDAYAAVGATWLGGVVTQGAMFSLATADGAADLQRYRRSLGIDGEAMKVWRVVRPIGPFFAMSRQDERFRAPLR